jgi:hypothetical protein
VRLLLLEASEVCITTEKTWRKLKSFSKAIKIFRRLGERMSEGTFLCNLGNALRNRKLFEKAENSHCDALDIIEEIGDKRTGPGSPPTVVFSALLKSVMRIH